VEPPMQITLRDALPHGRTHSRQLGPFLDFGWRRGFGKLEFRESILGYVHAAWQPGAMVVRGGMRKQRHAITHNFISLETTHIALGAGGLDWWLLQ
jgi:hypothetical protein